MVVVPTTESVEKTLPAAVDSLYRAVGALADPVKQFQGGVVRQAPSLYDTLVQEIAANSGGDTYSRGVARSIPTIWCDAVDLRVEIDGRVKCWQPRGGSTPDRLRVLASRRWRPQDVRLVKDTATEIEAWTVAIKALLEPQHVKTISAPCPQCSSQTVYRQHAGETVRRAALQVVAGSGCTCLSCGAHWSPDRLLFLCKLLGFELPAGVIA